VLLLLMAARFDLSVIAIVGIILLIGIVNKNGIMLVDFAQHLERNEGVAAEEAIYKACVFAVPADPDDHDGRAVGRRSDDDRHRCRCPTAFVSYSSPPTVPSSWPAEHVWRFVDEQLAKTVGMGTCKRAGARPAPSGNDEPKLRLQPYRNSPYFLKRAAIRQITSGSSSSCSSSP
jgi:hypothetical protein